MCIPCITHAKPWTAPWTAHGQPMDSRGWGMAVHNENTCYTQPPRLPTACPQPAHSPAHSFAGCELYTDYTPPTAALGDIKHRPTCKGLHHARNRRGDADHPIPAEAFPLPCLQKEKRTGRAAPRGGFFPLCAFHVKQGSGAPDGAVPKLIQHLLPAA